MQAKLQVSPGMGLPEMADPCSTLTLASLFLIFGYILAQPPPPSRVSWEERMALLQLRSSLGLRHKEWPIKSDPCVEWVGIRCTDDARVTEINISGFRRTRLGKKNPQFAVDSLQNLTHLTSFAAANFPLPGPIPNWFGLKLESLQFLDLRSCSITGTIPVTLSGLTRLAALYLSNNSLTGAVPASLVQLTRLSVLHLSRNSLTGGIPETLSNFTVLDMSWNSFSGRISPGIGSLSRLEVLDLSGNKFSSSIPPQLGNLSSLIVLDLGFNSLTGIIPSEFQNFPNLRRLVLRNNLLSGQLPDKLFPPLLQLQFLDLRNNNFSGDFPNTIWSLPALQFLDTSTNFFVGEMTSLNISNTGNSTTFANISNNLFYGTIAPAIKKFSFIDISQNYMKGIIPAYADKTTDHKLNCFFGAKHQRPWLDCSKFYEQRNLPFEREAFGHGRLLYYLIAFAICCILPVGICIRRNITLSNGRWIRQRITERAQPGEIQEELEAMHQWRQEDQ